MVTLSDFPETLWSWSMPYEMKILKIWASNYLPFLRYSQPKIEPLSEKLTPIEFFLFLEPFSESNNSFKWCHIKLGFFRGDLTPSLFYKKYIYIFCFFGKWQPFCFWKKLWKNFFSNFKGSKIKNRLFLWVHTWFS